jgi:DNA-directed RNA polymerase subunit RPC12/RpoP
VKNVDLFEPEEVEITCAECGEEASQVPGPLYPSKRGILCADCGAKEEAAYWSKVIVKRDGGAS